MTSQGHVIPPSLKQANKEYTEDRFLYEAASKKVLRSHP